MARNFQPKQVLVNNLVGQQLVWALRQALACHAEFREPNHAWKTMPSLNDLLQLAFVVGVERSGDNPAIWVGKTRVKFFYDKELLCSGETPWKAVARAIIQYEFGKLITMPKKDKTDE
jgi:hypothetical protein